MLALLTFLPMNEVHRLGALKDQKINEAKIVLAFEVTKLVHGEEEAAKAKTAAEALFGGSGEIENMPTIIIAEADFGMKYLDLLTREKVFASKSEGRRLIQQNGVSINNEKSTDVDCVFQPDDFKDGAILIKKGKKKYYRLVKA